MKLKGIPRRTYLQGPTPIEKLERLTAHLGGPRIYMKRDDLGFTEGGNKIRKLEFAVADALGQGADTLITCGAIQSNHCRLTLAAAAKEGLKGRLILEERVPGSYDPSATGNNLLYHLLGAEHIRVVPGGSNMMEEMEKEREELSRQGRKGYIIPGGASNDIGSLGYVSCALEILQQISQEGIAMDGVLCPSGSGGTHAGLLTGLALMESSLFVLGINVSRDRKTQEELIYNLCGRVAARLDMAEPVGREKVRCYDEYVGPGYSLPTEGMKEAVRLLARLEGILLDPVYSGKAMAGLIDLVKQGRFQPDANILFIHTGGVPALYAYAREFL